jgi:hypothetical protein
VALGALLGAGCTQPPKGAAPAAVTAGETGAGEGKAGEVKAGEGSAEEAGLACTLEVAPQGRAGAPVEVRFRLTNRSARTLHVLGWHTPLEGLRADVFTATRDGTPLAYAGPMVKRGEPGADAYVALAPGESREARVDAALGYPLREPGRYRIAFRGPLRDVTASAQEVPRPLSGHRASEVACAPVETVLAPAP